jgi:hypothetical protein
VTNLARLIGRYERQRRFWKNVRVDHPQSCWPWEGRTDPDGNGRFKGRPAHEYAYELARGTLPANGRLERSCGNPHCVNPDHLELRKAPA